MYNRSGLVDFFSCSNANLTTKVVDEFRWRTIDFFEFQGATFFIAGKEILFVDKIENSGRWVVSFDIKTWMFLLELFLMDGINLSFLQFHNLLVFAIMK